MTDLALAGNPVADSLVKSIAEGELTLVSYSLPRDISPEEFVKVGRAFVDIENGSKFYIGDCIVQAREIWGEEAYQHIEDAFGHLSVPVREQYARVSERIPGERRVMGLSWSHHRAVVALEPKEQDKWLKEALQKNWSKRELEECVLALGHGTTKVRAHDRRIGIADAAEKVYLAGERDNGTVTVSDTGAWDRLGEALGIIEQE